MKILSGKDVSQYYRTKLKEKVSAEKQKRGLAPGLAVVLVGEDPASQVYVRNKAKSCEEVGFNSSVQRLAANVSPEELKNTIEKLNNDSQVHGILVQLPLPKGFNEDQVLSWIDPKKDPDALTVENMGLLWKGQERCMPCTPQGVMAMLKYYEIPVAGKRAVVVGRSHIVGQPMAYLLQRANATVTVCHSKTPNTSAYTKEADIVVVAAGRPKLFGRDDFKKDSVVIDVGIHREVIDGKNKLCGDVRFNELDGWVAAATPVPGGVGPMTISMLLENTFKLFCDSF